MTYGEQVAKRFKKEFYDGRTKKWEVFSPWKIPNEKMYIILIELKSKEAINSLFGDSNWTKRLRKP